MYAFPPSEIMYPVHRCLINIINLHPLFLEYGASQSIQNDLIDILNILKIGKNCPKFCKQMCICMLLIPIQLYNLRYIVCAICPSHQCDRVLSIDMNQYLCYLELILCIDLITHHCSANVIVCTL